MNDEENTIAAQQKIIMLGDNAVGKTALVYSLTGREFGSTNMATMGVEEVELNHNSGLAIVDFGGQDVYEEKIAKKIKDLEIGLALICVSARQENMQRSIKYWNSQLMDNANIGDSIEKHLVITQCDVNSPTINELGFSQEYGFKNFHRTSAKTGAGIQELRETAQNAFIALEEEEKPESVNFIIQVMVKKLCELIARNPISLQDIEWRDLERVIAASLEELGFNVQLTPPSKDGGKDVIANCTFDDEGKVYFIEIKHWRKGGKPGEKHISDFVEVNLQNNTDGGLFLSSSGFTSSVHNQLGELMMQKVRLGDENKIVALCQRYVRSKNGLWQNETPLPELLFEDTLC